MISKQKSSACPQRKSLLVISQSSALQPKVQHINQAIQQKLSQEEKFDQSLYKSAKSVSVNHEKNQQDQRLRNFHKVMTESIQRHTVLTKKQTQLSQSNSLSRSKIDQRPFSGDAKLKSLQFVENIFKKKYENSNMIMSQQNDKKASKNEIRCAPPSPSNLSKVRPSSQLVTKINSLLQSAHGLQNRSPSSVTKRLARNSLYSSYKNSDSTFALQISNFGSSAQLVDDQTTKLESLMKRVQMVLCTHYNDKKSWYEEKQQLEQKLLDVQKQIEHLNQNTLVFIDDQKEVLEIDLIQNSPMNYNDLSFG